MIILPRLLILCILLLAASCDKGLAPVEEGEAFLSGKIIYTAGKEGWPQADSVHGIRIVAFREFPSSDIINEVVGGNAVFQLGSLPFFEDSTEFRIRVEKAPVTFKYIVVAHQYKDSITSQRVVSVYNLENDPSAPPSSLHLKAGDTSDIRLYVDWNNIPPQPF